MHLTALTDYALRVLIYTDIKDGDELTTIPEIARNTTSRAITS